MGRSNSLSSLFLFCLIFTSIISPSSCGPFRTTESAFRNSSNTSSLSCSMVDCTTMWLHPSCTGKMCHQHCLEAGGCQGTKTHVCETTVSSASDKGKQREVSPSTMPFLPSSSSLLLTATASTSTVRDMFANPRYPSQMTATFTEQHAVHQALEEKQRAEDANRLANIEKAKTHVIIYA